MRNNRPHGDYAANKLVYFVKLNSLKREQSARPWIGVRAGKGWLSERDPDCKEMTGPVKNSRAHEAP